MRKLLFSLVHNVCVRACVLRVVTVMRAYCILKVLHEDFFSLENSTDVVLCENCALAKGCLLEVS